MVGVGNIVSVGGTGGSGGGGSSSGIQIINGQTGPTVTFVGTSGIVITPITTNVINIGYMQSGVIGVNGIDVQQVDGNFVIDGAGLSGVGGGGTTIISSGVSSQYAESFTATTSGFFQHGFGTRDVVVQVYDDGAPPAQLFPDKIIYDTLDAVSVLFNRPQSGRVVIIGSGVACTLSGDVAIDARRYALLVS